MRIATLLATSIILAGCASRTPNVEPKRTIVDIPPIGAVSTVEVGSSLIQKARVFEYEAYELLDTYVGVGKGIDTGVTYTASPGYYALTRKSGAGKYFISVEPLVESCALGLCHSDFGGFIQSEDGSELKMFIRLATAIMIEEEPNWRKTTYADIDQPNFRRELIYAGRSGDTIRVLYREFSNELARPAFSQELTYDLSKQNIVGFQGVRIEILNISNVEVTYRVLSGFPDLETAR